MRQGVPSPRSGRPKPTNVATEDVCKKKDLHLGFAPPSWKSKAAGDIPGRFLIQTEV